MTHQRGLANHAWQMPFSPALFHIVFGLIGALTILYCTQWGIGLSDDSLGYLSGAENVLGGQGYAQATSLGGLKTINQWPPLYSLALTPFGAVGLSLSEGARWLNAILFGINIGLVGYLVFIRTALWPALFASLVMLTSPDLIRLHATACSEPLYFFLGLCGLCFLDKYIRSSKIYRLIVSALIISAAALTRYIGVTLIATLCISIVLLGQRSLRQRLIDCLMAGIISSLPLLMWLIRNRLESGHVSYVVNYRTHPPSSRHLKEGLDTISLWLMPARIPWSLRALAVTAAVLVMLLLMRWLRPRLSSYCYLNVIYVLVYLFGLTLMITLVTLDLFYDQKYLSPVFISFVLLLTLLLFHLSRHASRRVGIGIVVLGVLFSLFYVERAVLAVNKIRQNGLGWESPTWKNSKTIRSIEGLPREVRIYSNAPISIHFLSQRDIGALPDKLDPPSEVPAPDYLPRLEQIRIESQQQRTVIIYVNWKPRYAASVDELQQVLSLKEIEKTPEATIYEVTP